MHILPGLLEGMSFNGDGRDPQAGPGNSGLLLLRNLYGNMPCKRDIIRARKTSKTSGWEI